jgi:basic membrane lipoprotein Med (substrate-binding protein (PBP1-ABC) superfamily)
VIFATTPPLIGACRKAAAQYPNLRILNCSAAMPYTGVRTYYSRIYEAKFISGAIAGAMSPDGRIGYVASNPIFGVPASINAFALGARLTNPRAKIELSWSCVEEDAMEALARRGVKLISNRDIPTPDRTREPWGLCQVREDGSFHSIASPYWHWGNFYVKLVRSIFRGGWDALSAQNGGKAVNYWWGMKSRVVDVLLDAETPAGVKRLVDILRQGLQDSTILPFQGPMLDQEGNLRHNESEWFSPEEILHMDWLCSGVEGSIPHYDQLLPMARSIVRFQGLTRDQIPPEKEGPIL